MNGVKIAVIGLALLVLSACQGAPPPRAANEIIVGTEGAYPPWNLTRPDGTLDGFEPELLRALCARARLRCRLVAQDWSGMIAALDAKKIDMIADSVVVTPARTQVVRFTDPYARTASVFVTAHPMAASGAPDGALGGEGPRLDYDRPSSAFAAGIADLKRQLRGKTIGVQASGVYEEYLNHELAGVATIRTYRTAGERDLDLLLGRIDLTLEDSAYVKPLMASPGAEGLRITGPSLAGGMFGGGEAFVVRKGDLALRDKINRALASLVADGTLARLSLKWLRQDATPRDRGA